MLCDMSVLVIFFKYLIDEDLMNMLYFSGNENSVCLVGFE